MHAAVASQAWAAPAGSMRAASQTPNVVAGEKLHPSRDKARLVLARHGVGEGRAEAVPEGPGPAAQVVAAALVLRYRVDHQAALLSLPAGAKKPG